MLESGGVPPESYGPEVQEETERWTYKQSGGGPEVGTGPPLHSSTGALSLERGKSMRVCLGHL